MVTLLKRIDYEVIDKSIPTHVGIGGVKINEIPGGQRVVAMTPAQAQLFLDHGVIRPIADKPKWGK